MQLALPEVESNMLALPQVECPVVHHFGPGVYIREVTIPSGTIALGHCHRHSHMNIMLAGKLALLCDDGQIRILTAPMMLESAPGQKLAYAIETTVWQNVYATEERDIERLEEQLFEKSEIWKAHAADVWALEYAARQEDREDFAEMASEIGLEPSLIRSLSEDESDQIPFPKGTAQKLTQRPSALEGVGMFASAPIEQWEIIAPARLRGKRTPAGRFVNHSKNPNAFFVKDDRDDIHLVALRRIRGCMGGDSGEEITVDYRQAIGVSGIKEIV